MKKIERIALCLTILSVAWLLIGRPTPDTTANARAVNMADLGPAQNILLEGKDGVLTIRNDANHLAWGDQPTYAAAQGGPGCDSLLFIQDKTMNSALKQQFEDKLKQLIEREANGDSGLWMYLDSGASRSVIQENSPIRPYLSNVTETDGSCKVGNGAC